MHVEVEQSNTQDDDSMTMCLSTSQDDDSMTICMSKLNSRTHKKHDHASKSQDDDIMMSFSIEKHGIRRLVGARPPKSPI